MTHADDLLIGHSLPVVAAGFSRCGQQPGTDSVIRPCFYRWIVACHGKLIGASGCVAYSQSI